MSMRIYAILVIAAISIPPNNAPQKPRSDTYINVPVEVVEASRLLGDECGIEPELIQSICYVESRFQANAENDGCVGIMQVSEKWHQDRMERLGVTDLYDLRGNMLVGVDILFDLIESSDSIEEALMRYHGELNVKNKIARGQISDYAIEVLRLADQLKARNHILQFGKEVTRKCM